MDSSVVLQRWKTSFAMSCLMILMNHQPGFVNVVSLVKRQGGVTTATAQLSTQQLLAVSLNSMCKPQTWLFPPQVRVSLHPATAAFAGSGWLRNFA